MQTAQSTAGAPRPFPTLARQVVVACLLINVVIWPVKTIASLIYVRSLALRLPNLILLRRAKFLIRLALVIVVGVALIAGISALLSSSGVLNAFSAFIMLFMCAGFIAVLSWCITYAALIGGLRRDLVVISRRQSEPGNPVRTSHYH